MTGWNNLPNELLDMIADFVRDDVEKSQSSTPSPYRSLPLVSRGWQNHFSHINFHTLYLDQDRLDGLKRYLDNNKARQHHVKHIFLRVKVPDYNCSTCYQFEGGNVPSQHTHLFFNTLQRLFTITSNGGWLDGTRQPWVTLDIGIYSPSDGKHAFRDYRFSPDYHSDAEGEAYKRHRDQVASAHDDPCPGWQRAIAKKKPLMDMKHRLLSIICCPGCGFQSLEMTWNQPIQERPCNMRLPIAPVFTSLHFRRHFYRRVSAHLLRIITTSLPGVQELRWETWQQPNNYESVFSRECSMLLNGKLPSTIRHLSLHHHTPTVFHYKDQGAHSIYGVNSDLLHPPIFRTLNNLESLCLSNICDPVDFFRYWQSIRHTLPPNKLKRFIFVARIWRTMDDDFFRQLLFAATRMAFLNMPDLENMEIWCGEKAKRLSLRFSYTDDRQPMLAWSGAVEDQYALANAFNRLKLDIISRYPEKMLVILESKVDFSGLEDVCRASKNPELILLPESRKQIRYEEEFPLPGASQFLRSARYTRL